MSEAGFGLRQGDTVKREIRFDFKQVPQYRFDSDGDRPQYRNQWSFVVGLPNANQKTSV